MTQKLTLEYLRRFAICWSDAQLEAAAAMWPANPTWAWFVGERLNDMTRREAMERVHVAIAHLAAQRASLQAPQRPSQILAYFRSCSDAKLKSTVAILGAWLDAPDSGELWEQLATALQGDLGDGIIEAVPPPEAPPPADETPPPQPE